MTDPRTPIFEFLRPHIKGGWTPPLIGSMNAELDRLGAAKGPGLQEAAGRATAAPATPTPPEPVSGAGEPPSAILRRLVNKSAPALTDADFARVAAELGVGEKIIRAVREVEAKASGFDPEGRPLILYEKHVFARNTGGRFNASHPDLSAPRWQPGTYGPVSAQYGKLARAIELDAEAAFKACSWGAFQVLGENAVALGYPSAVEMALALTASEAAHLDSFVRFVKTNGLVDELRACRAGDAASCIPFVRAYNGPGYAANNYHVKLARAAA